MNRCLHRIVPSGDRPSVVTVRSTLIKKLVDDLLKSLQNALKHFMSWEPVKFNFNYIIQKDEIYKSEELPLAVEAVSSAPIIFTSEDVIEEIPEACPEEIPATEEIEMVSEIFRDVKR